MEHEYLISIVTPSHDTDDRLFRAAFESVTAQTIDESLVEWVIVVHNSSPEKLAYAQELCGGHPGFRVFELNNDRRTASSPINYALSKVTGKYITFLDADDRLTPECLDTIVKGMEETGAQVGKFRSEKLEEDSAITEFLDNRVRFDQTKPLISLQKDDPDIRKLMTMANMMMSSQVIARSLLDQHGIRFNEEVRIYEDVMFNMECLSHADTVAVFPQLIGYIYFMHHGSTMQELRASAPEKILDTCRDIEKQLRLGVESGLYMRYLFFGHMKQIADMITASEKEYDFPDETRAEIKSLMKPFFSLIEAPEPEKKFMSREEIDGVMDYVRLAILGPDDEGPENSGDTTEVLVDIMRSAEETEIGENWGFDRIRSHEAYESQIAVNTYDTFSPMIDLMSRIGESDILFSDPIAGYAVTSGTMNTPRTIPYTERTIGVFKEVFRNILAGSGDESGSCFLLAASVRGDRPMADRTYPDSITGAVLQNMRGELSYNSHRGGGADCIRLTGPEELYFMEAPTDPRYLRLLFALLDREVTRIASPFTWALLDTLRYLEQHHEELVSDIERGTLDGAPWLSSDEKKLYGSLFDADPERAAGLREIFAAGIDETLIRRIWPKCVRITAGGSAGFSLYSRHIGRFTEGITFSNGAHAASEAVIGTDCGDGLYRLCFGENYFEFIPEDREGEQTALTAEELEAGKYYELLLTNRSGLYRYELRDVIKVERMDGGTPVYRLAGRRYEMLIIPLRDGSSVRVRPDDVTDLILSLEERFDIVMEDWCIALDEEKEHIRLYIEAANLKGNIKRIMSVPKAGLESAAEEILREISPDYGKAASEGSVKPLELCLLQSETQLAYRDKRMLAGKTAPDQIKPVKVLSDDPAAQRFFDNFIVDDWR